jgi:hypothetical protein
MARDGIGVAVSTPPIEGEGIEGGVDLGSGEASCDGDGLSCESGKVAVAPASNIARLIAKIGASTILLVGGFICLSLFSGIRVWLQSII